jgi:alpha-glucosidase
MYYGDEIGMQTTPPTRREDVKDPIGILGWPKEKGRDGERTPMQWTPAKDAGFSTADHTWLPIPPNYVTVNAQSETTERNSMLNYYKSLLALRNSAPAFTHAPERMITTSNDADILAWARGTGAIVLCNFSSQPQTFAISDSTLPRGTALHVTLANYDFGPSDLKVSGITLPPFGAVVAQAVPETIPTPAP